MLAQHGTPPHGEIMLYVHLMHHSNQNHSNDFKKCIHWDKLSTNIIRLYERCTNDGFNSITIPSGVKCTNPNCLQANLITNIDNLYDAIIKVLSESSEKLVKDKHVGRTFTPGWNDQMKELHKAAREAYLLWKHSVKHRHSVVYDIMKLSRSRFKHGLRVCKTNKKSIIADKIAETMCEKNDRAFWREIKKLFKQ